MEIEENLRRSDEVQDILSKMPPWLIRWGNTFVFGLFSLLIIGSFIIKYPDLLSGPLVITSANPPAKFIAKESGRLRLLVEDGKLIKKNEYLGIIENASDFNDVVVLKAELPTYEKMANSPILINPAHLLTAYNLGELQESYSSFKQACEKYLLFVELQQNSSRISAIKKQLVLLADHKDILVKKKEIVSRELQIAGRQYNEDSTLLTKSVISRIDLDKSEEKFIEVSNKVESLEEELVVVLKSIQENTSMIDELFINNKGEKEQLESTIRIAYKSLLSSFRIWEQRYAFVSPLDGRVSFYDYWNNNQSVKVGDEVAYVVNDSKDVFARMTITGNRFGKVKKGQKVRILLDSYPVAEYGMIYGKVISISEVNKDNTYAITAALDQGLMTSYEEKLPFMPEMKGTGEIVTENMSLIKRIFFKTLSVFYSKKVKK